MNNPNDILITGIPRSGTTLLCYLLNQIPDTVGLNEPVYPENFDDKSQAPDNISQSLLDLRTSILQKGIAWARVKGGKITDNAYTTGNKQRERVLKRDTIEIHKPLTSEFTLAIKHCGAFTILLEELTKRYPLWAVIRNPAAILGSWSSTRVPESRGRIGISKKLDKPLFNHMESISGLKNKQIAILHWYFERYALLPEDRLIRYEALVDDPGGVLSRLLPGKPIPSLSLENKNTSHLYDRQYLKGIYPRLINEDGAFWRFYSKSDVKSLFEQLIEQSTL